MKVNLYGLGATIKRNIKKKIVTPTGQKAMTMLFIKGERVAIRSKEAKGGFVWVYTSRHKGPVKIALKHLNVNKQ